MTRLTLARRGLLLLASVVGSFGLLAAFAGSATAQAPVAPRAVYAAPAYQPAGYYYGGRYYQYNANIAPRYYGFSSAPTRSGFAPGSIYYQYGTSNVRDYSTARNLPFAKPWMRPLR